MVGLGQLGGKRNKRIKRNPQLKMIECTGLMFDFA